MLKNNSLYQYRQRSFRISEGDLPLHLALTKMSLFASLKSSDKPHEESFLALLNFFEDEIYFNKRIINNRIYWDVYAVDSQLKCWIESVIISSDFDYLKWPKGKLSPPQLLVFDMDSTFIEIEVIDELARCNGVGESVARVTESAMRGELDFAQSLRSRVACLKGLPEKYIQQIAEGLPLSRGVADLVSQCQRNRVKVAIVSGGFMPFVEHLKQKLSLYSVRANRLKINNQRLTGELDGTIIDAAAKATFVNELAVQLNLDVGDILTIGDGANDLKMMHESGFSLAYKAKPMLQAKATGRIESTHLGFLVDLFEWY